MRVEYILLMKIMVSLHFKSKKGRNAKFKGERLNVSTPNGL